MSKRKIHFLGFLANVDGSILKLDFGEGFRTERMTQVVLDNDLGEIKKDGFPLSRE